MRVLCYAIIVCLLPLGSSIVTKMACSVSGNGTCSDPYCFLTPISKSVNAINAGCGILTRPLNQLYIRQKFFFKIFSDFIPIDIFPDVELCSFVKKVDRSSFFYGILKSLNAKVPGIVHQCPYKHRQLQINNLTLSADDIALWVTGEYKVVYTFWDDDDSRILRVSARGVLSRN